MLGHDNVTGNEEVIAHTHLFQRALQQLPYGRRTQMLLSTVATEGHEMEWPVC